MSFAGIKCSECGEECREAPGSLTGGVCYACIERYCAGQVALVSPCYPDTATHRYRTEITYGKGYRDGSRYIHAPSLWAAQAYVRAHGIDPAGLQVRDGSGWRPA
jgi:hypothetical protein